jgi:hypothetical protein
MCHARTWILPATVCATLVSLAPVARAAWPSDPGLNVPLCTATGDQQFPMIAADGAGGAIVTWVDRRDTLATRSDVFAQRVNAVGAPQWTIDGVALCAATGDQMSPVIAPDGAGGAIIAWADNRGANEDIYAQRVNAAGVIQWTANGIALCAATGNQISPTIVSDGAGGAIVAWRDGRSGAYDIYAQRVNSAGAPQWTGDGVALCAAAGDQVFPTIAADGAGGGIVTWQDGRSGTNYDIYAQRVNAAGATQWTGDGVALCTAVGYQQSPSIVADGAGGAIVAWMDGRGSSGTDIYAQRIDQAGAPQWAADGVALCGATNNQFFPTLASDGAGGAIATWQDNRGATSYDIYVQRVNAAGAPQWTGNGVALCTADGYQSNPRIVSDGASGAIVTWEDARSGATHIFAGRVNAAGVAPWPVGGVALCTAANSEFNPAIAPDGAGGAIVAWDDVRADTSRDIYAQNVNADGSLGGGVLAVQPPAVAAGLALLGVAPNPSAGRELRVSFMLPDAAPATLELFDVAGRRVASAAVEGLVPGAHAVSLSPKLAPGVYSLALTQGSRRVVRRVAIVP